MSECYDAKLCEERHDSLKDKIENHEKRLNGHSARLDKLEQDGAELKTEIKNLCKQLEGLTSILKWFIGLLVGSFVAFFFYAVQNNIFK